MRRFFALKCSFFDKPVRMCPMRLESNFEDLMPKEETAVRDERETATEKLQRNEKKSGRTSLKNFKNMKCMGVGGNIYDTFFFQICMYQNKSELSQYNL